MDRNHILYFFLVPVRKIISVQEIDLESLFLYVVSLFEQHLNSSVRLVLLSGDMYPREPISNGINFTFALVMSGMKWEYFSVQLYEFRMGQSVQKSTVRLLICHGRRYLVAQG